MLNCSDPECILHHHHYYHGHVQHHLQDDRVHHEHPTHHPMSGESDGFQDAVIQDYLNDTGSELSSLSHLDAPNESVYMICGVLIAMLLVAFIIVLLAVTIRYKTHTARVSCKNCRNFCTFGKLRKREESSGVLRTNVVHPEGVLQATVVETSSEVTKPSLEDVFVTSPVSNRTSLTQSECSLSASSQSSDSSYLPMFLYSTGNSRNSLNSSDQNMLVHSSGPAEDIENNNHSKEWDRIGKKNVKGKIMKLVRRKTPPAENYALPLELREQLKQIYVY